MMMNESDASQALSCADAPGRYVDYGTLPPMPTPEEARHRLERIREKLGGDDNFVRMLTRQSREYGVGWLQSAMWSIDKLTRSNFMLTKWGDHLDDETISALEAGVMPSKRHD